MKIIKTYLFNAIWVLVTIVAGMIYGFSEDWIVPIVVFSLAFCMLLPILEAFYLKIIRKER